jgi:phosphohistidine swiveling domain-containing protein
MGIPCVVGSPGLMDSVSDGDVVDMDGTSGVVVMALPAAAAGGES